MVAAVLLVTIGDVALVIFTVLRDVLFDPF